MANLWDHDELVAEYMEIPRWINQEITPADVAAIVQGGCANGAYMPAVTYHMALATMSEYGDDVLDYIEEMGVELPDVKGQGWAQMACTYVSAAVELWAASVAEELSDAIDAHEEDGNA